MPPVNFGEDLIRIHKVMTRGLQISVDHSGAVSRTSSCADEAAPDPNLVEGFRRYVRALVAVLHLHHHGEDRIVWPFMRQRIPNAPYETLIAHHVTMADGLSSVTDALRQRNMAALHTHLDDINRLWLDHIKIEEMHFSVTATEEALMPSEHHALNRRIVRHAQLHLRPISLVAAFTLYNLPPEERAEMAGTIPPVMTKFLLPVVWKRAWAPMKPFLLPV